MDSTDLHEQLRQRAFLHNDPDAYLAGVADAMQLLRPEPALEATDLDEARGA